MRSYIRSFGADVIDNVQTFLNKSEQKLESTKRNNSAAQYLIWGGFGGVNLGDEAILAGLSTTLRKLDAGSTHLVLLLGQCSSETRLFYQALQVQPVQLFSLRGISCLASSRLIAGGGQLLDDRSPVWPVAWVSALLIASRIFGNRPLVLGIGAEPIKRKVTAWLVRHCYALAELCTFRDIESTQIARAMRLSEEKVRSTHDFAFALESSSLIPLANAQDKQTLEEISIVVGRDQDRLNDIRETVVSLTKSLLAKSYRVKLIPTDLRRQYDVGLLEAISDEFRGYPNLRSEIPTDLQSLLRMLASSDVVVSARMHPLILSSLMGTLPFAIPGTSKVNSLIRDLGLPFLQKNNLTTDTHCEQIETAFRSRLTYSRAIAATISQFARSVESTTAEAIWLQRQAIEKR